MADDYSNCSGCGEIFYRGGGCAYCCCCDRIFCTRCELTKFPLGCRRDEERRYRELQREDEGEEEETPEDDDEDGTCTCSEIPKIAAMIHSGRCNWGCDEHHSVCDACMTEEGENDGVMVTELIQFLVKESGKYETVDDAVQACKRHKVDEAALKV